MPVENKAKPTKAKQEKIKVTKTNPMKKAKAKAAAKNAKDSGSRSNTSKSNTNLKSSSSSSSSNANTNTTRIYTVTLGGSEKCNCGCGRGGKKVIGVFSNSEAASECVKAAWKAFLSKGMSDMTAIHGDIKVKRPTEPDKWLKNDSKQVTGWSYRLDFEELFGEPDDADYADTLECRVTYKTLETTFNDMVNVNWYSVLYSHMEM